MKGRRQPGWRQRGGGTSASVHACLRGSGLPTSGAIAGGGFLRLSTRSGTSSRSASVWRGAVSVGWLRGDAAAPSDRKSTRLNSSHGYISYAVFCLKKKKKILKKVVRNIA